MIANVAIVANVEQVSQIDILGEQHYNFEESLKKYLGTMSEVQIKNQVQQVLNYSDNITGYTEYDLASLVTNFSMILSKYTESSAFKASLNRSLECLVDFDILGRLDELKAGDNNSFLQVPVHAQGHLFGCVIYRMDENDFEFILINKGYRTKLGNKGYHDTCEAYMVPRSNLRYIVDNCLTQFGGKGVLTTEEVYDAFSKKGVRVVDTGFNKDCGYLLYSDIDLMDQKKGNCFYKNEEAALLFAWNNAMDEDNFNKLKSPLSTADLHVDYIENIRKVISENWYNYKRKDELLKFLDDVKDIYLKNKRFREYCRNNPSDSADEKRINVINIFLGDSCEYLKNLPSNFLEKKLEDSIGMMDLKTLETHMDVIELSRNKEVFRNVILFSNGLNNLDLFDIPVMGSMYIEFRDKYYNIAKTPLSQLDLRYASLFETYCYYTGDEEILKKLLHLDEYSITGNALMGTISEDNRYFDKMLETLPNMGYLIGYMVQVENNIDYNLYKYMKLIDGYMRRNSNDFDLKYYMVGLKNLLLSNANCSKIREIYIEELNSEDKDAQTYFNIGIYSWYLECTDEAKENFSKAGDLDNRYKYMYAEFLKDVGEKENALLQLDKIIEEDPLDIEALMVKLDVVYNMLFIHDEEESEEEQVMDEEQIAEVIVNTNKVIELLYNLEEGYLYRMLLNKYAYDMDLDIPDAKENVLDDSRKLYDMGAYQGEAIFNIYQLGELKEALIKCEDHNMYYAWMILWDLADKVNEDKVLAEEVENVLKKVINVNNVSGYNSIRNSFAELDEEGEKKGILDILDNVLREFFGR